ncbi:hypothetical protein HW40_12005 [Mannheimia haemolytica]|nr:hypothetical protein A2U20_11730 [Glaesserella parasuis D74]KIX27875.1 hypothetical protein HW40_12005 [Mannheimia haemolytica]
MTPKLVNFRNRIAQRDEYNPNGKDDLPTNQVNWSDCRQNWHFNVSAVLKGSAQVAILKRRSFKRQNAMPKGTQLPVGTGVALATKGTWMTCQAQVKPT